MIYYYIFLIFAFNDVFEARFQCKNMEGRSVDWFVVYKLPRLSGATTGKEFLYMDAKNPEWVKGDDINDVSKGVGATISQIYNSDHRDFRIMYSDDDPIGKPDSYRGHAKGVSLFDASTGFWMTHSVPNFPSTSGGYTYPASALKYGQSVFCVSMQAAHLSTLAQHWRYMQVSPYLVHAPDTLLTRVPTLRNVIARQSLPRSATLFSVSATIKSLQGETFMIYSKHRKFNGDIWNDIISSQNRVTLAVESWLNGSGDDLHTTCTKTSQTHDVTNIRVFGLNFKSASDHSKWAVSSTRSNPLVCFGDLNRQKSQLTRGGGAICLQHRQLWEIYYNSVSQVEPCKASTYYSTLTIQNIILILLFSILMTT